MDPCLPSLYAPFRSVLNPYAREADERVIEWIGDFHLAPSANWVEDYRKAKFTWFAARCFPDADLPQLTLAAAFNVWLFALDDLCDEIPAGDKYAHIRALAAELLVVMAGYPGTKPATPNPLIAALADLWSRLKSLSNPEWQEYFVQGMIHYLDACKMEASLLDQDIWPSVSSYIQNRPYLGAVHLEAALSEVLCGQPLSRDYREDARVATLTLLCCNIVCWSNDLFSLEKECRNGDKYNLALVLQQERHLRLSDAMVEAAAIHDEDVRHFVGLASELSGFTDVFPGEHLRNTVPPLPRTPALQHYITSLQHIISANMEWSMNDSTRYRHAAELSIG